MNNSDVKSVGAAPRAPARAREVEAWRPTVVFDAEPATKTAVSARVADRSISDYRPQERRPGFERRDEAERRWGPERVLRVTESAQRTVTVEATERVTVLVGDAVEDERQDVIDVLSAGDAVRLLPAPDEADAARVSRLSASSSRDPAADLAATGARAVERYRTAGAAVRTGPRVEIYASPSRDTIARGDPPGDQQSRARSAPPQRAAAAVLFV
jgi:hypothetical protein